MYCILGRLVDVCKRLCRWCLLSVILYHKFEVEDFLLSHCVKQQLLHTHTGIPIRHPLLPHTRNQIAATNLGDTGCVDSVFCQPTCGLCISHTYVGQTINRGVRQIVKYRSQNQVTSNRRRPWKPMAFQRPCTAAWWRLVSGSWFHVGKYGGMYNYSQLSPNLLAFSMGKWWETSLNMEVVAFPLPLGVGWANKIATKLQLPFWGQQPTPGNPNP